MKKTYVTEMPNHIGAFLQASRIFADLKINITRVSYNKAVDSHMLFIDVDGEQTKLLIADEKLKKIGYLQNSNAEPRIILVEFKLKDIPGAVTSVLELIERYQFNISYMSSHENDTDYQLFKMGLFVEDEAHIAEFLEEAKKLCQVNVVEYNPSEKFFDNSIFYRSFISGLADIMNIDESGHRELLVNANLAMQTLDERGLSPYRTFDSIQGFAKLLGESTGANFNPKIMQHKINDNSEIISIEPACGSNTFILKSHGSLLFIDCGYACYKTEMETLFRKLLPQFDNMERKIIITHADVDHCGILSLFDKIYTSKKSAESLRLEYENKDGLRERNPLHKPYIKMCKVLTKYKPIDPQKLYVLWNERIGSNFFDKIGEFIFEDFNFSVYEGAGGHLPGEIVLIDYKNRIVFTGDVFVNLKDMTREQKKYNKYAPILMTSVDTDYALCVEERNEIFNIIGKNDWRIFPSHGAVKQI